jgi:dTDP-4-amino-4,6-dideoxygalactose transaminase
MSKLAIKGGTPVAPEGLKTTWPVYGELEEQYLLQTLHSGHWCSLGQKESMVSQAEKEFARFIGTKYAMCVPSGTDALLLALRSLGVGAGDEVIVPAVTFVASASAIALANAIPIFVDIDPETDEIILRRWEEAPESELPQGVGA